MPVVAVMTGCHWAGQPATPRSTASAAARPGTAVPTPVIRTQRQNGSISTAEVLRCGFERRTGLGHQAPRPHPSRGRRGPGRITRRRRPHGKAGPEPKCELAGEGPTRRFAGRSRGPWLRRSKQCMSDRRRVPLRAAPPFGTDANLGEPRRLPERKEGMKAPLLIISALCLLSNPGNRARRLLGDRLAQLAAAARPRRRSLERRYHREATRTNTARERETDRHDHQRWRQRDPIPRPKDRPQRGLPRKRRLPDRWTLVVHDLRRLRPFLRTRTHLSTDLNPPRHSLITAQPTARSRPGKEAPRDRSEFRGEGSGRPPSRPS